MDGEGHVSNRNVCGLVNGLGDDDGGDNDDHGDGLSRVSGNDGCCR